ncbi:LysR family transcriptional regulator [Cupriavidus sp. WGtm5]|uniref:LysR family transcriptional regulator n=1 Tax=Cupriavidus sp. WGtm5 TaxID=2919926 RepID=UPI002090F9DD|nr:LysR family transcriptional regulator [Cupriavidus sp. WGtm5]MCO4891296.1 LysR family transcriptional regulator [Cupriavidus sp. WGtm5]
MQRLMHCSIMDLKLVVAIADAGNMTKGGAACFLAPSTASLRVKHLEQVIGTKLFKREARGVSPTRAGQIMVDHCRRCLGELEEMHVSLVPFSEDVHAQVAIYANSSAIASFLPGDLQGFLKAHPKARITLEEHVSRDILVAVVEGRADIGILTQAEPHPDLVYFPYREDEIVLLQASSEPWEEREPVSFLECLRFPFVSQQNGSAIHSFLLAKASELGKRVDVRIQVAGFAAVASMVRSGAGVAIVPRSALATVNCEGLRVVVLRDSWAKRTLNLCARKDVLGPRSYVSALLNLLRQGYGHGRDG